MQKRANLFVIAVLSLLLIILIIGAGALEVMSPAQAESRVAIVFNDAIGHDNFVQATEGAQKILNTMVNVADFAEVKNKSINSGFGVTEDIFNGDMEENMLIWKKMVSIKPVDDSFVLQITTNGHNQTEARKLAEVVAHEVSLEIPKLFTNLRGVVDQPRPVSHHFNIIIVCVIALTASFVCLWAFLNIFRKNNKTGLLNNNESEKEIIPQKKKPEGDPVYFLRKFLEEHQR